MNKHRHTEPSQLSRRIRLSSREIAISVALTVAALAGIVAFSFGQINGETAMNKPLAADMQRPE